MGSLTKAVKKSSSQPKTKRKPVSGARVQHPYAKIASLYESGKSWDEIAEETKIKRSSMNGISDRLAKGIVIDGKTIKIERGNRKRAA